MYLDLDFELLKPLDQLAEENTFFIGQEPVTHTHVIADMDMLISNGLIGSIPRHPFWKTVFVQMRLNSELANVLLSTGPFMVTKSYYDYVRDAKRLLAYPIVITQPGVFNPYPQFNHLENTVALCRTSIESSQRRKNACDLLGENNFYNYGFDDNTVAIHHWGNVWTGNNLGNGYRFEAITAIVPEHMFWPNDSTSQGESVDKPQEGIPKLLHQVWIGNGISQEHAANVQTWLRHHETWKYRFWNLTDIRALIATQYSEYLEMFDGYPSDLYRIEAGVYFILNAFGGVYVSLELESLNPIDDLLVDESLVLAHAPREHCLLITFGDFLLTTDFIASAKGHAMWKYVLRKLTILQDSVDHRVATGHELLYRGYANYQESINALISRPIQILSQDTFNPGYDKAAGVRRICSDDYDKLSQRQKLMCNELQARVFQERPPLGAPYAINHWYHVPLSKSGAIAIDTLVPADMRFEGSNE